jgi:cytochrome oxidase Cu insertion factor (SCO1/SenC/PrrC family)
MRRLVVVVFVLVILLLWNMPGVMAQTQFVEAGVEKFRVPVEAPDFALTEVGGGKVSLKELRGKIILLNFFATW